MNWLMETLEWIADPTHQSGPDGLWALIGQHLAITGWASAASVLIGVPLGYLVGHTGRGRMLVVGLSGAARALPAIGLLTLVALVAGIGLTAPLVALAVLATPSVIAGAYSGFDSIEPATLDAARAMGMSPSQVLTRVEIPLGLPQLLGGIRAAVLQVIATATLAAYVGAGGLGVYLFRGLKTQDYAQMLASAVLIVVLALLIDVLFEVLTQITVRAVRPRL
ncbi:osmoprotectant transport system permease protein [Propionibacterium cyclohexanicum]|uniref:Osmoprotectant transport system permease protein n=1 Tax=Propionibacterium cyclohexanicum TaxID=64702 RepID=A0A1H9TP20_9ACTN|nr:ABC transporter permease [Propionibacterium cyclohexanicum]SER98817.1 osmoprotectant transport system permease protein [Propionibacterium cyclohexanicum]